MSLPLAMRGATSLMEAGQLCSDACHASRNGICDDLHHDTSGACAFGSDCTDCGKRVFSLSPKITVCRPHSGYASDEQLNAQVPDGSTASDSSIDVHPKSTPSLSTRPSEMYVISIAPCSRMRPGVVKMKKMKTNY